MLLFLDTEFTDLINDPRLLSVGIVSATEDGSEFYAEVNNHSRLSAANDFVQDGVIPQFGNVPGATCSYRELHRRPSCSVLYR